VNIEIEREDDGRWIAEVSDLPGVMVYGHRREETISKVKALALRVLADRLEHGERIPELRDVLFLGGLWRTSHVGSRSGICSGEAQGLARPEIVGGVGGSVRDREGRRLGPASGSVG
jgi:predicted RNase H-like HicB family nuclease